MVGIKKTLRSASNSTLRTPSPRTSTFNIDGSPKAASVVSSISPRKSLRKPVKKKEDHNESIEHEINVILNSNSKRCKSKVARILPIVTVKCANRSKFTAGDKKAMVDFVVHKMKSKTGVPYTLLGNRFWAMAARNKITQHSYQSMTSHFRKKIAPQIDELDEDLISGEDKKSLKQLLSFQKNNTISVGNVNIGEDSECHIVDPLISLIRSLPTSSKIDPQSEFIHAAFFDVLNNNKHKLSKPNDECVQAMQKLVHNISEEVDQFKRTFVRKEQSD